MTTKLLVVSAVCASLGLGGVARTRRSIDPPVYGHGGRSARSLEMAAAQHQQVTTSRYIIIFQIFHEPLYVRVFFMGHHVFTEKYNVYNIKTRNIAKSL